MVINDMIILFTKDLVKDDFLRVFYMDFESKIIKVMNIIDMGGEFKIIDIRVNRVENIEIVFKQKD